MTKMSSMMAASEYFAQTAAPANGPGGADWRILIFYGFLFAAMYFILFAPQRKKQKELAKMLAAITTGDEVITTAGIYGTITNVKDDRFVVRVADNTKIEVGKAFVQAVVKKSE